MGLFTPTLSLLEKKRFEQHALEIRPPIPSPTLADLKF